MQHFCYSAKAFDLILRFDFKTNYVDAFKKAKVGNLIETKAWFNE